MLVCVLLHMRGYPSIDPLKLHIDMVNAVAIFLQGSCGVIGHTGSRTGCSGCDFFEVNAESSDSSFIAANRGLWPSIARKSLRTTTSHNSPTTTNNKCPTLAAQRVGRLYDLRSFIHTCFPRLCHNCKYNASQVLLEVAPTPFRANSVLQQFVLCSKGSMFKTIHLL